jgi:hypothetical protein
MTRKFIGVAAVAGALAVFPVGMPDALAKWPKQLRIGKVHVPKQLRIGKIHVPKRLKLGKLHHPLQLLPVCWGTPQTPECKGRSPPSTPASAPGPESEESPPPVKYVARLRVDCYLAGKKIGDATIMGVSPLSLDHARADAIERYQLTRHTTCHGIDSRAVAGTGWSWTDL